MSSPAIVSCLLGIYFFMAGCLQIALHVSTVPTDPFGPFLQGLLIASWPLGVAGLIFILLDIRQQLLQPLRTYRPGSSAGADDEPEIPEAPVQPRQTTHKAPARQAPAEQVTYFRTELPQQEAASNNSSSIFVTPPPFRQQAAHTHDTASPGTTTYPVAAAAAAVATPPPQPPPLYSPTGDTVPIIHASDKKHAENVPPPPKQQGKPAQPQGGLNFFKV